MTPTPKQLAQQRRFTRMVRARARFEKANPGVCYYCRKNAGTGKGPVHTRQCPRYRANNGDVVRTSTTPCSNCLSKKVRVVKGKAQCASCGRRRNPSKRGRSNPFMDFVLAPIGGAIGETAVSAFRKRRKKNPRGVHLPGLAAKFQRMYEDIISSVPARKKYGPRLKEVAARTVRKRAAAEGRGFTAHNPRGKRKSTRRRNPSPRQQAARNFEEFRGKPATGEYDIETPDGSPKTLSELGRLEEITLVSGEVLAFDRHQRLLQTNNHKLIIGGDVRMVQQGAPRGRSYDMGEIAQIVYWADKQHIPRGKRNRPYKHDFESPLPRFVIDPEGKPKIVGGGYTVKAPGIEG